jgi:DNA modification methylase
MELQIKEEFKKFIPPLTVEEFKQLEDNCIAEGIRDAIVTWQGFIIDGHNRYEIAQKHGLKFRVEDKEFEGEEQAKDWMDANQLGRRNLTPDQRKILIGRRYNRDKNTDRFKGNQYTSGGDQSDHNQKTSERLAKENNTSAPSVRRYGKDAEKFDEIKEKQPELADKIWSGEKKLSDIKKEENVIKLQEKKIQNAEILSKEVKENRPEIIQMDCVEFLNTFKDNSIDLLITDPPYSTDVKDINTFAEKWVDLALSKIKPNGRGYICIGGYPKEINAYLNILLKQNKFIVDNPLIWTYKNTLGVTPKMKYNLNYQVILHLYSETSRELETSITSEMWSVMEINAPDGRIGNRYHTWQKPDELGMRLIKHSTVKNDLVVDCFACTGTFMLMAAKLDRIAKGCDIDNDNLQIAKQRGCTIIGK